MDFIGSLQQLQYMSLTHQQLAKQLDVKLLTKHWNVGSLLSVTPIHQFIQSVLYGLEMLLKSSHDSY